MEQRNLTCFPTLAFIKQKLLDAQWSGEVIGLLHAVAEYFIRKRSLEEREEGIRLLMHWADRSSGRYWQSKTDDKDQRAQEDYWNLEIAKSALHILCSRLVMVGYYINQCAEPAGLVRDLISFFYSPANVPQQEPARKQTKEFLLNVYYALMPGAKTSELVNEQGLLHLTSNEVFVAAASQLILKPLVYAGASNQLVINDEFSAIPLMEELVRSEYERKHGKECRDLVDAFADDFGFSADDHNPLVTHLFALLARQKIKAGKA